MLEQPEVHSLTHDEGWLFVICQIELKTLAPLWGMASSTPRLATPVLMGNWVSFHFALLMGSLGVTYNHCPGGTSHRPGHRSGKEPDER